jgi:hypothetical protein
MLKCIPHKRNYELLSHKCLRGVSLAHRSQSPQQMARAPLLSGQEALRRHGPVLVGSKEGHYARTKTLFKSDQELVEPAFQRPE